MLVSLQSVVWMLALAIDLNYKVLSKQRFKMSRKATDLCIYQAERLYQSALSFIIVKAHIKEDGQRAQVVSHFRMSALSSRSRVMEPATIFCFCMSQLIIILIAKASSDLQRPLIELQWTIRL
jgi:hypothetical protein